MIRLVSLWLLLAGFFLASYGAATSKATTRGTVHTMEDGTPIPPNH
jgi:hypothetical protein